MSVFYEDPYTGERLEMVEVVVEDDDSLEPRNAAPREHRGSHVGRRLLQAHRQRPSERPRPGGRPLIVRRPNGGRRPVRDRDRVVTDQGDAITINKSAIVELAPVVGQLWASFLGRPEAPQAVGDDIVDRNNAAMHREALALHQQNQTRILALTDLAARAAKLFV